MLAHAGRCMACNPPFGSCSESDLQPASDPIPARVHCPNDVLDPSTVPNRCLDWTGRKHCVGLGIPLCTFNYGTLQDAVDSPNVLPWETIHVFGEDEPNICGTLGICHPPRVRFESVAITQKPVCLKSEWPDFYRNPPDWTYTGVLRSAPSSTSVVSIGPGGSGSCIQGFKLDHRGTGTAVLLGTSASGQHADNVTLVRNVIDVSQANTSGASPPPPSGISIAGKGNHIYRNMIQGAKTTAGANFVYSAGVNVHLFEGTCAEWDGNEINGNQITSFERGVNWENDSGLDCSLPTGTPPPMWTGNRIDLNDITDCGAGVRTRAGFLSYFRLIIMRNQIRAGTEYGSATQTPPLPFECEPDRASQGLLLGDLDRSHIKGNHISGVQIGLHLGYTSCFNRVESNQVSAVAGAPPFVVTPPKSVLICPSHCNWLVDNEVAADGSLSSVAVDYSNRQAGCYGPKPAGTQFIDGGLAHDARCIVNTGNTPGQTTPLPGILSHPARFRYATSSCQQ